MPGNDSSNDSIKKLLEEMKSRNQPPQQAVSPTPAVKNTKTMTILGPDGPQQVYTFDEHNKVIDSQALPGASINTPPPAPATSPKSQQPPGEKKPENNSTEKSNGQDSPAEGEK
jgi:hypothetical protein